MLSIITIPTTSLRERSKELDRGVLLLPETQQFIDELITKMYADDGIGIASPQVGKNIRLVVIGKQAFPKKLKIHKGIIDTSHDLVLVNPTWQRTSKKEDWDEEGCLSVPKVYGKVKRWRDITVEALDRSGQVIAFQASNFFARVIQHEYDHIEGILFIDKAKDIHTIDDPLADERLRLVEAELKHKLQL